MTEFTLHASAAGPGSKGLAERHPIGRKPFRRRGCSHCGSGNTPDQKIAAGGENRKCSLLYVPLYHDVAIFIRPQSPDRPLSSKQGVHALVNGEQDRPVGAILEQALIRVCVRWIAASQCLAPIRTGLLVRSFQRRKGK